MKKILCVLVSFVLAAVFNVSSFAFAIGDVDGNEKVTAADARLVLRCSAKLEELNEEQLKSADVDFSGKVTSADARTILRVASKIEQFTKIDDSETTTDSNNSSGSGNSDWDNIPRTDENDSAAVYITPTGKKYHRADCRTIKDKSACVNRNVAEGYGYEACKVCNP